MSKEMKMIIDTDCGIDDAVTIMSAIKRDIDVLGITTVAGNTNINNVTENVENHIAVFFIQVSCRFITHNN